MRRIIFVLSLAGIAGFSILILPPVFSMIVNYALSLQSMWWHTDEAGFVKAMVLEAGIGGILFSLLTLLSSLGALEKLLSLFIKKARLYGKVLFWPVLLAPIVYLYVIIAVFGVNYPQGEDWNYLRDFIPALLDGSMSAWDFILAQCDSIHFHIIPYALACALLVITGCNIKMLLFVANTFWIIPYFCFARYIRLKYQAGGDFQKTASVLLASAIGFMLVNISQRQIFLHLEWAFGYGIACAFMFCAFAFFEKGFNAKLRGGGVQYIASVILAFAANISYAYGVTVIPAILSVLILLALSKEASVKKEIVFFTASYAAYSLFLLYLRSKSAYSGAAGTFINPAVTALSFILALGNFTGNQILAPFAGAAFLTGAAATVVYVVKNKRVKDNLFPLCLLSFGLAHTLGVGLGRGGASPILVGGFRSHAALIAFCAFSLIVYNEFISGRAVLKSGTKKILAKFMVKDLLAVFLIFGVLSNTLLLSAGHYKKELRENQRLTLNYRNLTFDDLRHIHGGGVVFKNFDIFEYLEERKWLLWRKNASRY